jgi:DNA-binding NtrC family response regulator
MDCSGTLNMSGDASRQDGQSVLIVDDDEGFAQILALILDQEGFETRTAGNGVQGCAAYFREPAQWVVTDIQMPQLDGLKMMQCIRAVNPGVKTLYMSGEVDRYQEVLGHEVAEFGARVLVKPFTKHNLLEQIDSVRHIT